jgi:hypothetical protein
LRHAKPDNCGRDFSLLQALDALTTDAAHRSLWLDERGLTNVMAVFLLQDNFPQGVFDNVIRGTVAKDAFQIMLVCAEEAGAHFTIRGEAQAVAVTAERFRYRCDNPNFGIVLSELPAAGCFRLIFSLNGFEVKPPLKPP